MFGVCNDCANIQVNYLINEEENLGKGADCVISIVHHYLENYGSEASDVLLQADNCVGQNKNNCTMQYLVWRTMTKRYLSVELSFMLTGQTKFSPDHFLGLFKKLYMHSSVDTTHGIATLVKQSSLKGQNIPQLIYDSNGHHLVHFYNWTSFLSQFF